MALWMWLIYKYDIIIIVEHAIQFNVMMMSAHEIACKFAN